MDESNVCTTSRSLSNDKKLSYFSFLNIQGLKPVTVPSKVPYLKDRLIEKNQLFVALTETWLKAHIDEELNIDGYQLFRGDRIRNTSNRGRYSGGVAIYLRNDLAASAEVTCRHSNSVVEILTIYSKKENLLISVLYRQPDDQVHGHKSQAPELYEALLEFMDNIPTNDGALPDILFGGDFNLPHVNWKNGGFYPGSTKAEQQMAIDLHNVMDELCLFQIIDKPTHKDGNILDLVFTNNKKLIHSFQCIPTANSISHHSIIETATSYDGCSSTTSSKRVPQNEFEKYNYFSESIDWLSINEVLLKHKWDEEFEKCNHEEKWKRFLDICLVTTANHVPKRKPFNPRQLQIPRDRKILLRRRRKIQKLIFKDLSQGRTNKLKRELLDIETKLQISYTKSREMEEEKAVSNIKKNPKFFYAYAKKNSKVKTRVGPLLDKMGEYEHDFKKMADLLQDQYTSVFSNPKFDVNDLEDIFTGESNPTLDDDVVFDESDVIQAIDEISDTSAAGPDGVSAYFLKKCKLALAHPLYILYRDSLDQGIVCDDAKRSNIIPLHKGGSLGVPANYRPVSLTSHLVKILEKIIRRHIVKFIEEHDLFNSSQHGFRAGRSCLSQLLEYYDRVLKLLEEGHNVDTLYLDFSKAFDKVDHGILLQKLKKMGISGNIGNWIYSFLSNRKQTVMVNGVGSRKSTVISGVPQGTVLGPILFLIFIADIDEDLKYSFLSSFADDTRLYKIVDGIIDNFKLQSDLNKTYVWTERNNMSLNDSKFQHICHGKKDISSCYLSPSARKIELKDTVKDLGIYMDSDCTFSSHIDHVVEKMKEISGWILRTFRTRSPELMLILWKSLVLPHHDYCSQLWSPAKTSCIQKLEMVQRAFIKKIDGMYPLTYWEQLKQLGLYSLERRRERYRIIYTWKIAEGLVPDIDQNVKLATYEHIRYGRMCYVPFVRNGPFQHIRCASFNVHGLRLFNTLSRPLRDMKGCNLQSFKEQLNKFLECVPDEPQIPGYVAIRRADTNSLVNMVQLRSEVRR